MTELIGVNEERCIGCGACIRVCPSPLANTVKIAEDGRTVTAVNSDKCIACGECVKICKAHARDYEDDTDRFFKELKDRKVVVVAHPSIKTAFPGTWQAVLKWFKQNGADGVYDGAFGADICTWAYVRAIEQGKAKNVLSQHCPAIVKYMELYHPNETKDLSPVHSPVSCEAVYIRDYVKKNYAVAVLTPCPAMKLEFESTGHAEYNITFKRLKEYFRRKKIDFNKAIEGDLHYDFDDQSQGMLGGIYPLPGGLSTCLTANLPDLITTSTDGADRVYKELDIYAELPPHRHPQVFEALSCSGGCGCGCGIGPTENDQTVTEIKAVMREVEIEARSRRKVGINGVDKQFKLFDDRINPRSLMRNYDSNAKEYRPLSDKELAEDFEKLGKKTDLDKKIDCGACGYGTCKAMAEAIHSGRNIPSSCIRYREEGGAPAAQAAPAGVIQAADNSHAIEIAEKVSGFANNLLADIENIYASLHSIDDATQKSASMSSIVVDIMAKVVGFCSSVDSIDEENLPMLISTLEKLQGAVASLHDNVSECASGSGTIREAMQEVSDATTELNVMAHDMVTTLSDKY